jgi:2-polyprenyl-3-methyl-5-hydroxy-6-metoxy-1,4-benzoquinol methylase
MAFGKRDKFEYVECSNCGCLQIIEVPTNLSRYYPDEYYTDRRFPKKNSLKYFILRKKAIYSFTGKGLVGKYLTRNNRIVSDPFWFNKCGINFNSKILDIGCAYGYMLGELYAAGFSNLTGIDPFIKEDIYYANGFKIFKKEIHEVDEQFDFITMHHSFEHTPNPFEVFENLYRILKPDRFALIRIPVADSFAWKKYGVNWVQLDAPRHLFLHTSKSMELVANRTGFKIVDVTYDSTEFQFWGSEQYLRDIPLNSDISYNVNPQKSIFTKDKIDTYRKEAKMLNLNKQGDQACFYLYKE